MILVIGATGNIGRALCAELTAQHAPFKALVRSEQKATALQAQGVATAVGDLADPASLNEALQGVSKVCYIPPLVPDLVGQQRPVLDAARAAGVTHLVRTSGLGAQPDAAIALGRWHGTAEHVLEQSGLSYTHLRPASFMQNFLAHAPSIANAGAFYTPGGPGRQTYIDVRDIGAACAAVLTDAAPDGGVHAGRTYELTGAELLSMADVAEQFSAVLRRPVRQVPIPSSQVAQTLQGFGMPQEVAEAIAELGAALAQGYGEAIASGVLELTGHPPRSFAAFIAEHRAAFGG